MLTQRSQEKELLDLGPDFYTPQEFADCHIKLFRVNKLFGFFSDTKQLLKKFSSNITVLDVGCGAGLFLLHLSKHFPKMTLTGTDICLSSITLAQQELQQWQNKHFSKNVLFKLQAFPQTRFSPSSVDVIITTMVCHHLDDEALIKFMQQLVVGAKNAVIINDLHRHRIAEFFYSMLSPLLFNNRLITHDGLISIRRGFTRSEWHVLLKKANIQNYTLKWRFPFRWSLVLWK